jgi:hypothetical protein
MYGEDLALREAIEGVQRIRTWAEAASKLPEGTERALSFRPKKSRHRKTPLREPATILVGYLGDIYPKYFGRKFSIYKLVEQTRDGRPAGHVDGRGLAFVQACLAPLGVSITGGAVDKAWAHYRDDLKSPAAK